jgi:phosphoglycolate phosphatase
MTCSPRAVIWDLDGTLIDSAADLTAALNELLLEHGSGELPEAAVRPMIGDGAARLVERAFAATGTPLSLESRDMTVRRFLRLYSENAVRETRRFDGALAVMDRLTRAGCVHGICTNKPHAIATVILERLGFAERTAAVVGGDSTPHNKPHPAPLLSCLRQLGVSHDHALMIGDSAIDVLAARAAGLPVIVVGFGYSRGPTRSLGADAVVERLDQLPAIIAELASPRRDDVVERRLMDAYSL